MKVAIVGGGFAGLFTATRLLASGVDDFVVLESSNHPGGVTRSVTRDGYTLEPAAGSFTLPHPHLSQVLGSQLVKPGTGTARTRHVWDGARMVTLRPGPAAALAPLVPGRAKARALLEMFAAEPPGQADESLDHFCRRRLGDDAGRTAAWLAASGVFAGDPRRLSARAAFPALTGLVDSDGSMLRGALRRLRSRPADAVRPSVHVPLTTMSALADQLAAALGDRFRARHRVTAIRRVGTRWLIDGREPVTADRVVIACAPDVAAGLVDGDLAAALGGSVMAPVVVVGVGGPASRVPVPDGFGILTGPDAATAIRGVLLESSYAPARAPSGHGLMKVIAGGAPRNPIVEADDATVIQTVGSELARILGKDIEASFVQVVRHARGIPQYQIGHSRWLAAVEAATPESMHLVGWGYRGVGMGQLGTDAVRVAAAVAA
ncbi:MAG TPA: protoporphyrinogen oxidase [Acidimicrobiia bacterium]|nr:protoporphyrinogen oxidase [Acidimicrobiia bacterium]